MEDLKAFGLYLTGRRMSKSNVKVTCLTAGYFLTWLEEQGMPVTEVCYNDMIEFIRFKKAKGLKASSLQKFVLAARHYFDHLKKQGIIKDNPVSYVRVKNPQKKVVIDTYSEKELSAIYNEFDTQKGSDLIQLRRKAIIGLLIYQGLTATELKMLLIEDVSFTKGTIYIAETLRSNTRVLKLEAIQYLPLQAYISKLNGEKLFPVSVNQQIYEMMLILRKRAYNIDVIKLRTSVIINWLRSYNIIQVKYMTGHKYISSTERYKNQMVEELQKEVEKYHPLL